MSSFLVNKLDKNKLFGKQHCIVYLFILYGSSLKNGLSIAQILSLDLNNRLFSLSDHPLNRRQTHRRDQGMVQHLLQAELVTSLA